MGESGFFIQSSNSLPRLLDRMAGELRAAPLTPLEWERIVVQSAGMRRWVTLELARAMGIAASISMPFPRNAAAWLARKLLELPDDEESDPFNRQPLTWRLMAILGGNLPGDEFAPIRAYLADNDMRKRYQLASKIAGMFDEYQLYRTELLRDWDIKDRDAEIFKHLGWQSKLWRRVCAGLKGRQHLGEQFRDLIDHVRKLDGPVEGMPRRLSVFGASSLPPIFIELLAALGKHIPVTVYRFSPTRVKDTGNGENVLTGNRLLDSMGGQGRDFLGLLLKHGAEEVGGEDLWVEGGDGEGARTCLQVVQDDILDDVDRGGYVIAEDGDATTAASADPVPLDPSDRSLTIHNCHSPLREMEVLHDLLLEAFDTTPDLVPSDVLVMVPNIADYTPYIDAVFGVRHDETPHIPYRIADRRRGEEQPLSEGVLKVLALADARLTATEVIDLLEIPSVRRKAGILGSDLPQVRHWVRETNIRWGVDGDFKKDVFGLPPFEANTWRAGLDRLLMGMITGPRDDLVAGILPLGTATMNYLELLGRFDTWVTDLFGRLEEMRTSRSLNEWADLLSDLLEDFFAPVGDEEQALQSVREELNRLRRAGESMGGAPSQVEMAVVRDHLEQSLSEEGGGVSFISGAVTFCALKPMRTIPFRLIAVAGLDDSSFPSKERPPTFDLMAAKPLPGDRSVRADQKQLFLETLAAARDRLIISYVGRSQKDNKERAASVVVDELLNVVDQSMSLRGAERRGNLPEAARMAISTLHPLQPFNPAYFDRSDSKLFSYSRQNCQAAEGVRSARMAQDPPEAIPFFTESIPLAEEHAECLELTLDGLIACWSNPCRFFCNKTLGIILPREEAELEDTEPLEMLGLERYAFENWLAGERLRLAAGHGPGEPMPKPDLEREWRILQARGDLPPGQLGRAYHAQLGTQVQQFVEQVGAPRLLDPLTIDLKGDGWRLTGRIENLTDQGRVQFRCAKLKPKDIIRAWVTHVVLNMETPMQTRLIARDDEWTFGDRDRAGELLEELLGGLREALQRPLPFFAQTSYAYFNSLQKIREYEKTGKGRKPQPLWKAAYGQWQGDQFHGGAAPGERDDPYIALCFRDSDPLVDLKEAFEERAEWFWGYALGSRVNP
jgi:exodeoxyribonuclease V gamma subunit